ncbi:hypothetical protein MFIFM68171_05738 [Madurella fahalii]|uniref:Zinc metalloproteinase n=1 Tax=Madurella fahalii TaxID=1157608 RepID=A0ABQ0GCN4_9PEZI
MWELDNFTLEERTVHQRCVLLSGKCDSESALEMKDAYIEIGVQDEIDQPLFPRQRWPMCHGFFKALVLLSPGLNRIAISCDLEDSPIELRFRYTPLLQKPPLHLAIMVAKDSPLMMDCPPAKFGGISSTHCSLDAAIAKFRMAAYMWQALTAEDMRAKGLGLRSFRLEEEWSVDTLSSGSLHSQTMGSVPKVHLVRTDKTVAELRDADLAQQNPCARRKDDLHSIFTKALQAYGAPFVSHAKPVVAGLILDSHYDISSSIILAHAALGCHNPNGLSLGMFGSHLTYAWPRFLEEVPDCLLDTTLTGDTVGNDNGECGSMWEACAVGQGAFLHEVGHAFSAPHTSGIMARGYSPDWPKAFLACTAPTTCPKTPGMQPVTPTTPHDCRWDLGDALRFRNLRHFWVECDRELPRDVPTVNAEETDGADDMYIETQCAAGIAMVVFTSDTPNQKADRTTFIDDPPRSLRYFRSELAEKFDAGRNLSLEIVGFNGKQVTIKSVWRFLASRSSVRVPGTDIRLLKECVGGSADVSWAVMLKKRNRDGVLVDATMIDLRVGCALDGVVVYYGDGEKIPCGPRGPNGNDPPMGGHQSRKLRLPKGVDVEKVAVTHGNGGWDLMGLRMWLSNGKAMGALNCRCGEVETLMPLPNQKIIGFYGSSSRHGMCSSFGIITAPRDIELPDSLYDMDELQNKPEDSHRGKRQRVEFDREDEDSDVGFDYDPYSGSEDTDHGYDDGSDEEVERIYRSRDTDAWTPLKSGFLGQYLGYYSSWKKGR